MTTVVLVDAAEEQLDEIAEWWTAHRLAVWGAPKVGYPVLLDPRERTRP